VHFAVVVFPGSNCDADCYHALKDVLKQKTSLLWHLDPWVSDIDCVILPGGFSYGDYLRAGAIARFSPIMKHVKKFAAQGGLVLGICNGFQILCESGLLPGALYRNQTIRFKCEKTYIRVERTDTPFTNQCGLKQVLQIPIAHGEGNFYLDQEGLKKLQDQGQILFRGCNSQGEADLCANPNGSLENIAGICNTQGNVVGMMPHPERNVESFMGSRDGLFIFRSIIQAVLDKNGVKS
jgi:phosphoribosylformylglycinamidine synthase I